jgi:hypothetical protein
MTRKDYRLIAFAMFHGGATQVQAEIMANALATTNPRFDRNRFLTAVLDGTDGNLS